MKLSRKLSLFLFLIPVSVIAYAINSSMDAAEADHQRAQNAVSVDTLTAAADISSISTATGDEISFINMIGQLKHRQVVFVGEQHTRFDHHLLQLMVLESLHQYHPRIAIGVEWFQQGFQDVLDDYVLGNINETEMLRKTEYYERWKFDYRLYRPIMQFARRNQLPVIALNAPVELTNKVSKGGLKSLSAAERSQLPENILPPTLEYREHLNAVFQNHDLPAAQIDRFITVQRIWDETMAANSLAFLKANPGVPMVVFAGVGHMSHDAGIPGDLIRQQPEVSMARVLPAIDEPVAANEAEFVVSVSEVLLPATGKMGVWLGNKDGRVSILRASEKGAAAKAGIQSEDVITSIDGSAVGDMLDLRMAMDKKLPGDTIDLLVKRDDKEKAFKVVLE